jgi:hypothetical protein
MPGSDWEGELGDCDFVGINVSVPWLLACLSQRLEPRTLDLLGMGPGIDICEQHMQPDPEDDTNPVGVNGVKSLNGMSLKVLRHKLCWYIAVDTLSTLGSHFSSIPPYRVVRDSGT